MREWILSLGVLEGCIMGLQVIGLALLAIGRFRPSRGLRLACLAAAVISFTLPPVALLVMGSGSGWTFLGLLGVLLGLRAVDLARRAAERWVMAGALILALGFGVVEAGRGEANGLGGDALLGSLAWGIGLAELLFAGLLGLEEGLPATGTWTDFKPELVRALRHAFVGLAFALVLSVLRGEARVPVGAPENATLLLLVGALLHQQRLKAWPRRLFQMALCVVLLAGLAVAFRWSPAWVGPVTPMASQAFHQGGLA